MWQTFGRLGAFAELLPYDALQRCDAGDIDGAIHSVQTLLGLAHALSQDPLLGAQTHRRNFLTAAVRVTERILNRHRLRADQLSALRQEFQEAEIAAPLALSRAFIGERCLGLEEFRAQGRQSPFFTSAPSGLPKLQAEIVEFIAEASGIRDRWLRQYLGSVRDCITKAGRLATGATSDLFEMADNASPAVRTIGRAQLTALESYWKRTLLQELEVIARLRLVQTALAIEQFRSQRGDGLPDELRDLTQLDDVETKDPFVAERLRYVCTQPGYLLYSVGPDQLDDHGTDPGPNSRIVSGRRDVAFRVAR